MVTSTQPTIGVVIAVRNAVGTLDACLRSVFDQRYPNVETIVIDGGSTDGTLAIVEQHAPGLAYWESARDRGVYHAWNKALDQVRADWILFLGSDDRLHGPEAFSRIAASLREAEGRYRVVYGRLNLIDRSGAVAMTLGEPWSDAEPAFRSGTMLPHPATFHHRTLFERYGRFDDRYKIAGDYEFLLRELLAHVPLFVPHLITDVAAGGISDRPETDGRREREKRRALHAHGLTSSPEWRSSKVIRAMVFSWLARQFGRRAAEAARRGYRRLRGTKIG